jgi:hypothetical protein
MPPHGRETVRGNARDFAGGKIALCGYMCEIAEGNFAHIPAAGARQPVDDKYVHSATRCAWWQTPQFCQNKIATAGLRRFTPQMRPNKLQMGFWTGSYTSTSLS